MIRLSDLSLRLKTMLLLLFVSTVSIAFTSAVFIGFQSSQNRAALERELRTLADVLATNTAAALVFEDAMTAAEVLQALRRKQGFERAALRTKEGAVFATFPPEAASGERPMAYGTHIGDRYAHIAVPVTLDGSKLGSLEIIYSLEMFAEEQQQSIGIAFYIALGGILIAILLSVAVQDVISRPVRHLASTMKEVSRSRDYSMRAQTFGGDELGRLADIFNEMLSMIQRQHQELEKYRHGLEVEVATRTDQLSRSNQQLSKTVHELERAKTAAEAASRAKSNFLANMSHELRTPLNAIIGFSEAMMTQLLGPIGNPRYSEYIQDIHRSGAHLLALINDVLDIARVEAGKSSLAEEDVEVIREIDHVTGLVRPAAERKGVILIAPEREGELPLLRSEALRFRQIMLNLLSNAIKFTRTGGEVRVWEEVGAHGLTVKIADTGIGIRTEEIPRLLQPFEQVENATARQHEGSGLGLALTNALVRLHDGELHIESTIGKGTTVSVFFPPSRLIRRVPNRTCDHRYSENLDTSVLRIGEKLPSR